MIRHACSCVSVFVFVRVDDVCVAPHRKSCSFVSVEKSRHRKTLLIGRKYPISSAKTCGDKGMGEEGRGERGRNGVVDMLGKKGIIVERHMSIYIKIRNSTVGNGFSNSLP